MNRHFLHPNPQIPEILPATVCINLSLSLCQSMQSWRCHQNMFVGIEHATRLTILQENNLVEHDSTFLRLVLLNIR